MNTALQKKSLQLEEAHRMISTLKASLSFCQKDFSGFWQKILSEKPADVDDPKLPRKRKVPKRFETNDQPQETRSIEEIHESQFTQVIDAILNALDSRFEGKTYQFLMEIEKFVLGDDINKAKILDFYKGDIDPDRLIVQRDMLLQILEEAGQSVEGITDIINYFKEQSHLIELLPELVKFLNIFVTIPSSSATAERSFSGLRRLKTYLRSTMGQKRLNSVSLLHFHKDMANEMDLNAIIDEFISRNEQRKTTFYM